MTHGTQFQKFFAGQSLSLPDHVDFRGELVGNFPQTVYGPDELAQSLATTFDVVRPHETVCIVVSDQTRKTACDQVLSVLVKEWMGRGCRISDFTVLAATGIHRPPTPVELADILGADLFAVLQPRVFSHNPDDSSILVEVGKTRRGHPVRVNRRAIEADKLILIGTASYHYHAGFGGGRKLLVPGLASRDTIAFNHSLTLDPDNNRTRPGVGIGRLDGNAVAEEMLEAAQLCHPDLLINTVLLPDGHSIVGVHSGELESAHRSACKQVEVIYRVLIPELADIVIADATGAPNWIQSHKALFNAALACKPDGTIILVAPCPEGLGDEGFRQWMKEPNTDALYRRLRETPEILGQTALSTRERGAKTILVTDLNARDREALGMETAPDIDSALTRAIEKVGAVGRSNPTLYTMPQARYTVPEKKAVGV